jgi:hypothetical protein
MAAAELLSSGRRHAMDALASWWRGAVLAALDVPMLSLLSGATRRDLGRARRYRNLHGVKLFNERYKYDIYIQCRWKSR